MKLTFVTAANDSAILRENLLSSPCLQRGHPHQILIREGFSSAAAAYNTALALCENEIIVFIHQDVYLPVNWVRDLELAHKSLEATDPFWGVLGCWGVRANRAEFGYLYTPGQGVIGSPLKSPVTVQTLDEVVLIIRKSSGLRFNERIRGFHLYGTDICLEAASKGLRSYAISAFCIHNSTQHVRLPTEFYVCCRVVKNLRRSALPIQTSCIRITRGNSALIWRRVKEFLHWALLREPRCGFWPRATSPLIIEKEVNSKSLHGQ